jgi:hypothetical protein
MGGWVYKLMGCGVVEWSGTLSKLEILGLTRFWNDGRVFENLMKHLVTKIRASLNSLLLKSV